MGNVKVVPRSLTEAYKRREGDFSPNLVGLQFTDGASLFTFGNFQITTNLDRKLNKNFSLGGQWSEYYSLDNLNLSQSQSETLVSNEIFIRLNFDPKNISRYIYFGSFHEYLRVTLEQIIQKWKGGLYVNPTLTTNVPLNTVLSFKYDSGNNTTSFLIPKSVINNPFELIIDYNVNFYDLSDTDIFNLSRDYSKYVVSNKEGDFKIIGYTGSTDSNPYISVITNGNPFPSLTASTFGQYEYLVKPNDIEVELFFNQLDDFEKILLNRLTKPIYTSTFNVPKEVEGSIQTLEESFTWPVSDGYNIDINTRPYALFVESILAMAILFDQNKTDLVARRFVSESIHEFDTNGGTIEGYGEETYGRKANKLLRIYGREYDQVKKYIDGISFANVVTYDKLDNTSDELIKTIAKNLGFDVLLTVGTDNFNLLEQIQPSYKSPFSGYSRSLTSNELDIELWRRLVINAWWLFRSKGTRKVIEFFFNLFNIPQCMVTLDEYVYLAENKLDIFDVYDELVKVFELSNLSTDSIDLNNYPLDEYGFPRMLPKTNDNYFQSNGFWYNGGTESTEGNNPHIGSYDFGGNYYKQFKSFVPNFNEILTSSTSLTVTENYFNNYNKGTFVSDTNLTVPFYGTQYANVLNNNLSENIVVNKAGLTKIGDINSPNYSIPNGDDYSMKINFTAGKEPCNVCDEYEINWGTDGIVYTNNNEVLKNSTCCDHYWSLNKNTSEYNCYWCDPDFKKICDIDEYIGLLTTEQIVQSLINLGLTPSNNITTDTQTFKDVYSNTIFKNSGCLMLDSQNNIITDKSCCELRGGDIVDVSNSIVSTKSIKQCYYRPTITCNESWLAGQTLWLTMDPKDSNNTIPLSKNCCNYNNKYWVTNATVTLLEIDGNTTVFKDIKVLELINKNNVDGACSSCDNKIKEEYDTDVEYVVVKTSNGYDLDRNCCINYGFNWDSDNYKCSVCPTNYLYNKENDGNSFISDINNNQFSEKCCNSVGQGKWWYGDAGNGNKCYACPPIKVVENGVTVDNLNYYTINTGSGLEMTYNGKSIMKPCCGLFNNTIWDSVQNKCLINE